MPLVEQDPFFQPLLGSLVKVVFLSSALHQLAFTLGSSLPFAVGQVGRWVGTPVCLAPQ